MSEQRRRARLNDIAATLREPVEVPDFTSSILERVHAEKPFVPEETRRWVPIVRFGAAGTALLGVFAMTLIVFVNPELPEEIGAAPPSVTTELVQSAETGLADKVAEVRETVQAWSRVTDPLVRFERKLRNAHPEATPLLADAELSPDPSIDLGDAPFDLAMTRPEPMSGMSVSFVAVLSAPLPTPLAMALPQLPPETSDYAVFTRASFSELGFASDGRSGGSPWQRAVAISQPRVGFSGYPLTFAPSRPRLNHESPTLVKELFPLITGQPAGDELQIR